MATETIIFIGPEGSGKSTIGKLMAETLNKELYSLDRHRNELYAPYNYSQATADKIYEEQGLWPFWRHWSTFEFKAVTHILENAGEETDEFYGKILDFGAGHSVYESLDEVNQSPLHPLSFPFHFTLQVSCRKMIDDVDCIQLSKIEELMKPFPNVFLFLPCEDVEESIKITEERRGHELGLNRFFLEHESNKRLAKFVIYTKDTTPEECMEKVLAIIREGKEGKV
jgi:energy-coupling factor transporter ATP-binding protein EcfA2